MYRVHRVRSFAVAALAWSASLVVYAQPPSKWPPDSLVNVQVIPKNTSQFRCGA